MDSNIVNKFEFRSFNNVDKIDTPVAILVQQC